MTFIGSTGTSLIDYYLAREDWNCHVTDLEVKRVKHSVHLPIIVMAAHLKRSNKGYNDAPKNGMQRELQERNITNSVNRNALFYKLYNMGISSKFGRVLQNLPILWLLCETIRMISGGVRSKIGILAEPKSIYPLYSRYSGLSPIEITGLLIKDLLYGEDIVLLASLPKSLHLLSLNMNFAGIISVRPNYEKVIMNFARPNICENHREKFQMSGLFGTFLSCCQSLHHQMNISVLFISNLSSGYIE